MLINFGSQGTFKLKAQRCTGHGGKLSDRLDFISRASILGVKQKPRTEHLHPKKGKLAWVQDEKKSVDSCNSSYSTC